METVTTRDDMKINYWAVILAVVVTFIASAAWYIIFSTQYFELRGINPNDAAATAMPAWQVIVLLVRHLLVTLVIAQLVARLGVNDWKSGLKLGLLLWIGFPVVLLAGAVANDNVPLALAAIHAGDWLIKLLLITTILAVWRRKQS